MVDRRVTSSGARDLDFISSNPATDAYQDATTLAQKQAAADVAIEHGMLQNAEQRAGAPTRLRTLNAQSDTARANADVDTGTVGSRISTSKSNASTAGSNALTAGSNARVTVATEPNRITQSNDATRTGTASADVAVATVPDKITASNDAARTGTSNANVTVATEPTRIATAQTGLRQANATALNSEMQSFYKSLELLNAGNTDAAKTVAEASGHPLPDVVINNAEVRQAVTAAAARAKELYPDRPKEQQAYIEARIKAIAEQRGQGQAPNEPTAAYTMPPGAPEPTEDNSRGYFEWVEGKGVDPATGQTVAGTWKIDRYSGTEEFTPGQSVSSHAAGRGGAGHDPANVATAKWLIDKGIAKTPEEAWTMVNTGKSNPQAMATQVYNAALRSTFGNSDKAKKIVQEWQTLNAQRPMAPGAPAAAPAPTAPARPAAPAAAAPAPSSDPLARARDAIARGADRNAVIQRLQQAGIDPSGL